VITASVSSSGATVFRRNNVLTPFSAARMDAVSSISPFTASTPVGKLAFSGERVRARTSAPRGTSWRITSDPTVPVLPVTNIDIFSLLLYLK